MSVCVCNFLCVPLYAAVTLINVFLLSCRRRSGRGRDQRGAAPRWPSGAGVHGRDGAASRMSSSRRGAPLSPAALATTLQEVQAALQRRASPARW